MILDRLIVHNFGVYKGRQEILLSPESPDKPIILIGGLNGGGKTTLLDAIKLALYGKLATCSNRNGMSYGDFLRRSISHGTDPRDGAGVEVWFRSLTAGSTTAYRVCRTWKFNHEGNVRERVDVYVDDHISKSISEQWLDHIETILPQRLAQLAFFDGEKVEELATEEKASQIVGVAVNALMGVDVLRNLVQDLKTFERKQYDSAARVDPDDGGVVTSAIARVEEIENSMQSAMCQLESARNDLTKSLIEQSTARQRFLENGGLAFEERDRLNKKLALQEHMRLSLVKEFSQLAMGDAPLLLVRSLIEQIVTQDKSEKKAEDLQSLQSLVAERDSEIIRFLTNHTSADVIAELEKFFKDDIDHRFSTSIPNPYLSLSREARYKLEILYEQLFQMDRRIQRKLGEYDSCVQLIENIEREIERIPEREKIEPLLRAQIDAESKVKSLNSVVKQIEEQIAKLQSELEQSEYKLTHIATSFFDSHFAVKDSERTIRHSRSAREVIDLFIKHILKKRIGLLESLVLESFQQIAAKPNLVKNISIDPETFKVILLTPNGEKLGLERLSAGERQLMAISTLWAMSRASGRLMPTIIDTPLGRLDSKHRINLVNNYFPVASYQVILLSTDKEIDFDYHRRINKWTSREYLLKYSAENRSSSIRDGYFTDTDGESYGN
jgi:DNA sulfur modification protein DndD